MKLIIAGSRYFTDYALLKSKTDYYLRDTKITEIVSGRCIKGAHTFTTDKGIRVYGADGLGERYAKENSIPVKPFPADWKQGKKAGPIRNELMAIYADALLLFWDGASSGSASMLKFAEREGLKVRQVLFINY